MIEAFGVSYRKEVLFKGLPFYAFMYLPFSPWLITAPHAFSHTVNVFNNGSPT